MSEALVRGMAIAVVATQLVLPLALGAPVLLSKKLASELTGEKRKERKARRKEGEEGGAAKPVDAKKLAPLRCPACGAAVPLEGQSFRCRHCDAEVQAPAEYASALEDRQATAAELVKAERMWRLSRWTSSALLLWPVRAALVAWLGLVLFCAAGLAETWPGMVLFLAIILAIVFVGTGLFALSGLAGEREKLPSLPSNDVFEGPAADGTCTSCGAALHFPEKRIAMLCLYCGAEAYRVDLAKAEARKARSDRAEASRSLLDAMRARRDRTNDLLLFVVFMAIAEVFYGAVFTLAAVADFAGC